MKNLPPVLLASQSPRRKELLTLAGIPFEIKVKPIDEAFPPEMDPAFVPVYLSQQKSLPFAEEAENHLIITCDTVVVLNSEVLNKPVDLADAKAMLRRLSGQRHTVVSGVTLRHKDRSHSFAEVTEVWFRELAEAEIDRYVDESRPLDRAGAYGIQDSIGVRGVSRIEGDFYNVMGLPVCRLVAELEAF